MSLDEMRWYPLYGYLAGIFLDWIGSDILPGWPHYTALLYIAIEECAARHLTSSAAGDQPLDEVCRSAAATALFFFAFLPSGAGAEIALAPPPLTLGATLACRVAFPHARARAFRHGVSREVGRLLELVNGQCSQDGASSIFGILCALCLRPRRL